MMDTNNAEHEVIFTVRELQPFYDCLVRATLALERIASSSETILSVMETATANSAAFASNMLGDVSTAVNALNFLGMGGEEDGG